MTTNELSGAELVFAKRMLAHFMAGKSTVEAAAAVLEDDVRIFNACVDDSHSYQGFNGANHFYSNNRAKTIATELSNRVYRALQPA